MQLHALLASFFDTKVGECELAVIYKASTVEHKKGYEIVAQIFGGKVNLFDQDEYPNFRDCLGFVISRLSSGKLFFLVDDIIFTEAVDYKFLAALDLSETVFSLRMGEHLEYSYVVDSLQPLPEKLAYIDGYLGWQWRRGHLDWGYPLSVDGHIFSSHEVRLWIKYLEFGSPSSFESSLQNLKYIYRNKRGMSYGKARLLNIPANKVQDEVDNFHGAKHQDDLLRQWLDGMAIEHRRFRGLVNRSVHEEAEFNLIKRGKG